MKPSPIATNAFLVTQGQNKNLPQCNTTVLDSVMRVHIKITSASELEVDHRMLCKQSEHVVKERNASINGCLPRTIQFELDGDTGLFGLALQLRLPGLHAAS